MIVSCSRALIAFGCRDLALCIECCCNFPKAPRFSIKFCNFFPNPIFCSNAVARGLHFHARPPLPEGDRGGHEQEARSIVESGRSDGVDHAVVLAHAELPRHGHGLAQLLNLLADVGGDDVGVELVPLKHRKIGIPSDIR